MTVVLSNVKEEWLKTKGSKITIGVCDSGIDKDRTEFNSLVEYKYFGELNKYSSLHGNHVCGIIFGSSIRAGTIHGFCSLSKSYVSGFGLNCNNSLDNLFRSIEWLSELKCKIDVLNLSFACEINHIGIEYCLKKMYDRGTWIFASHSAEKFFPWSYDFVNSVGYDNKEGVDICAYKKGNSLGVGFKNSEMSGSSISCAITTGVAGLYRSYNSMSTIEDFKREIDGDKIFVPPLISRKKVEYLTIGV